MGIISDAVTEGIEQGFEETLAGHCDGYEEPEDRCMMRPEDGCACLHVRWRKSKWWQFIKEPMKPKPEAVLEAITNLRVGNYLGGSVLPRKPETTP